MTRPKLVRTLHPSRVDTQRIREYGTDMANYTRIVLERGYPIPKPSHVWGLGVICGERQRTVVSKEDEPKIRETLERAAEYARKHR
jgi:hypothetical protein